MSRVVRAIELIIIILETRLSHDLWKIANKCIYFEFTVHVVDTAQGLSIRLFLEISPGPVIYFD